jgi:hypothetical protein
MRVVGGVRRAGGASAPRRWSDRYDGGGAGRLLAILFLAVA